LEKQGLAKILEEIGVLLELQGESSFKSRAYYNAARIIEQMGEEELQELVHADKLREVDGIGEALNEKIKEYVFTGFLSYYEDLKASIPDGLLEILKVPGLGPRKVKALYELLEITTLAELEYACRENRLVSLKGFGAKTQDNILAGIEFLRHSQGKYFYKEAKQIADHLLEIIREFPNLGEAGLAGSIRRCREIVKDIDLVASAHDPGQLTGLFVKIPAVSAVIVHGETKASIRLPQGINADLRVVKKEEFPYALHHFTGSKEHNTAMRQRAKSMGMKINEYGLFRGNELVRCRDEVEFFNVLNLSYIPPELREGTSEIEAAAKGKLPPLLEKEDIKGVFHVHSHYSDGMNSLEEIVLYCREYGYEYVGIADHSQSAYYAGGMKENELLRQIEEIETLQERYPDIGIFCGVESDIRSDGSLDYDNAILEKLDFVIASVHSGLKMEKDKMNHRLLKALANPRVTMLGHPTNRLLLGRDSSHLDMEKILHAARENNVILELNASPARLDLDWRYLKKTKELGVQVSINPDAHQLEDFQDTDYGVAIARKGWLEKKDVFNTLTRRQIAEYFRKN